MSASRRKGAAEGSHARCIEGTSRSIPTVLSKHSRARLFADESLDKRGPRNALVFPEVLSGFDAKFLYRETASEPWTGYALYELDTSTMSKAYSFGALRGTLT